MFYCRIRLFPSVVAGVRVVCVISHWRGCHMV